MAKPTSYHRPEFAKFVGVQTAFDGQRRYQFYVPSKHEQGARYVYLVNDDGSAPYCSCMEVNEWAQLHGCYLCLPEVAREMAERGRLCAEGKPVPVGF